MSKRNARVRVTTEALMTHLTCSVSWLALMMKFLFRIAMLMVLSQKQRRNPKKKFPVQQAAASAKTLHHRASKK